MEPEKYIHVERDIRDSVYVMCYNQTTLLYTYTIHPYDTDIRVDLHDSFFELIWNECIQRTFPDTETMYGFRHLFQRISQYPSIKRLYFSDSLYQQYDLISFSCLMYGKPWCEILFGARANVSWSDEFYSKLATFLEEPFDKSEQYSYELFNTSIMKYSSYDLSVSWNKHDEQIREWYTSSKNRKEFFPFLWNLHPSSKVWFHYWTYQYVYEHIPHVTEWCIDISK